MKRLYTFGCSYTFYAWPTWSEMLGAGFDEKYNWGCPGIGNRAIVERLAECHQKNRFTEDDLVIVQWTSHLRNDYFNPAIKTERKQYSWGTSGSIFNVFNSGHYNEKWLKTFFDEAAYLMHSLNYIKLAQDLLDNSGCKWYMTGMGELRNIGFDLLEYPEYGEQKFVKNTKPTDKFVAWEKYPWLEIYNSLWTEKENQWLTPISEVSTKNPEDFFRFTWENGKISSDLHPTVNHHSIWLKENLLPKLDIDREKINAAIDIVVKKVEKIYYERHQNKDPVKFFYDLESHVLSNDIKWPRDGEGFN